MTGNVDSHRQLMNLSGRYHPLDSKILYTVINMSPPRSRKSKTIPRQAFICKWNTSTWTVEKMRKVGDRQITCFDIRYACNLLHHLMHLIYAHSNDGRLVAFGSSDLSIGLLDTNSFSVRPHGLTRYVIAHALFSLL
jgi:prolactin regulatory element-binding protein